MARQIETGKIEEIIYARLEPGEDLLRALWDICREKDVKTGLLLDATGALEKAFIQRWPTDKLKPTVDFIEIPGPLEVSAQGILGIGWVPDASVEPPARITKPGHLTGFGAAGFVGHNDPYFHVHMSLSNSTETVCGHLMEGSPIHSGSGTVPSHFTVVIAKVSGVVLRSVWDKSGLYHQVVPA